MGLFKNIKDMNEMVKAAPGMIQQGQALGAQAQQMALAQQAAAEQQAAAAAAAAAAAGVSTSGAGQLDPIAGVSLQQYATVSKGLAAYNYDQTKAPLVASQHGIDAASWEAATVGWNGRITNDPAVASAFNTAYRTV
jgi:hypothetical protein